MHLVTTDQRGGVPSQAFITCEYNQKIDTKVGENKCRRKAIAELCTNVAE